jgi:hypothetical protein
VVLALVGSGEKEHGWQQVFAGERMVGVGERMVEGERLVVERENE